MKYTPEQYKNMVEHVNSTIMDAELHNGRIRRRLEVQDDEEVLLLHKQLQDKLLECVGLITDIEDRLQ
jgi:hypothetical protein